MIADRTGQPLEVGDLVNVPCRVVRVEVVGEALPERQTPAVYVCLETLPVQEPRVRPRQLVLHPAQVEKAPCEDPDDAG